jgi:hypothetical protein
MCRERLKHTTYISLIETNLSLISYLCADVIICKLNTRYLINVPCIKLAREVKTIRVSGENEGGRF